MNKEIKGQETGGSRNLKKISFLISKYLRFGE